MEKKKSVNIYYIYVYIYRYWAFFFFCSFCLGRRTTQQNSITFRWIKNRLIDFIILRWIQSSTRGREAVLARARKFFRWYTSKPHCSERPRWNCTQRDIYRIKCLCTYIYEHIIRRPVINNNAWNQRRILYLRSSSTAKPVRIGYYYYYIQNVPWSFLHCDVTLKHCKNLNFFFCLKFKTRIWNCVFVKNNVSTIFNRCVFFFKFFSFFFFFFFNNYTTIIYNTKKNTLHNEI